MKRKLNTVLINFFKASLIPLILLLIIIVAFKEVAFFIHPLKWDALDCTLPWKYFISTCFSDGIFPFWNPYQHVGYPFYGDAQSTIYYPLTLAMTYLHSYSFKMLSVDFIFHVWIGSVGMYFLGRSLKFSVIVSFILAIAYTFSGFMIGNAQHIYWIISAAWLPYVIWFYIKMQVDGKIFNALMLSLFLYLLISGGYPAFVIILAYIFVIIYLIKSVRFFITKNYKAFLNYTSLHIVVIVFTIGLSFVYFVSIIDNYSFSDRAGGLSLNEILLSPFSLESFISFLLPLSTIKGFNYFGTDLSLANGYFGLIVLWFFLLSLFSKKNIIHKIILAISIICLMISVGEKTYIREFLYHYVPLFDTFRFPSAFRLFFIIGFILSAGFYLNDLENKFKLKKTKRQIIFVSLIAASFYVVSLLINTNYSSANFFVYLKDIKISNFDLNIDILKFVQSVFALIILVLFIVMIAVVKSTKKQLIVIAFFVVADMFITTRLLSPYTVHSPDLTIKELNEFADRHFVKTYTTPNMNVDVFNNSDTSSVRRYGIWRNINIYYGQIAHGGFSSFINKNIQLMEQSFPDVYSAALHHKPVYASKCIMPYSQMSFSNNNSLCDYADVPEVYGDTNCIVNVVSYNPNKIEFIVETSEPTLICYLQSWHKYWTAKVNGKTQSPVLVNHFHMGVVSEAGNNTIVFEFKPKFFYTALTVSIITLTILLLLLLVLFFKKQTKPVNKQLL